RRRHTIFSRDWSSDVCSSDLKLKYLFPLLFSFAIANAQEEPVTIPEQTIPDTNEQQALPSETNQVTPRQYRLGSIKVTGNYHFKIGRASCRERVSNEEMNCSV